MLTGIRPCLSAERAVSSQSRKSTSCENTLEKGGGGGGGGGGGVTLTSEQGPPLLALGWGVVMCAVITLQHLIPIVNLSSGQRCIIEVHGPDGICVGCIVDVDDRVIDVGGGPRSHACWPCRSLHHKAYHGSATKVASDFKCKDSFFAALSQVQGREARGGGGGGGVGEGGGRGGIKLFRVLMGLEIGADVLLS